MRWRNGFLVAVVVLAAVVSAAGAAKLPPGAEARARNVAGLINPTNLATLKGERAANSRVQKYVAQLAEAWADGFDPAVVAKRAAARAGMKGKAGTLTAAAMVRNLDIAQKLGCLDAAGLADMRRGQAATIRKGPYAGEAWGRCAGLRGWVPGGRMGA